MHVTVKYISEIITARMKEIIEALLYHIQVSGYATEDILRAGVVVTGGGSDIVNCANFIKELSGYSVKIGLPRRFFSCEGCPEAGEASASTSMGMIMAAKGDKALNCINESPGRRFWTAPKPAPTASAPERRPEPEKEPAEVLPEPVEEPVVPQAPKPEEEEPAIEETVIATVNDGDGTLFGGYSKDEIEDFHNRQEDEGGKGKGNKGNKKDSRPKITWIKRFQTKVSESVGSLFDGMDKEEV